MCRREKCQRQRTGSEGARSQSKWVHHGGCLVWSVGPVGARVGEGRAPGAPVAYVWREPATRAGVDACIKARRHEASLGAMRSQVDGIGAGHFVPHRFGGRQRCGRCGLTCSGPCTVRADTRRLSRSRGRGLFQRGRFRGLTQRLDGQDGGVMACLRWLNVCRLVVVASLDGRGDGSGQVTVHHVVPRRGVAQGLGDGAAPARDETVARRRGHQAGPRFKAARAAANRAGTGCRSRRAGRSAKAVLHCSAPHGCAGSPATGCGSRPGRLPDG